MDPKNYTAFADEAIRSTLPLALERIGNQDIAAKFRRLPQLQGDADLMRAHRVGAQVLSRVRESLYITTDYLDLGEEQTRLVDAYWTTWAVMNSVQMALRGQQALN